jgi:hypothetical protein
LSPVAAELEASLNKQPETKNWVRFRACLATQPVKKIPLKTPSPPGKNGGPGERLSVIGTSYFFFFALGFAFFLAAIDLLP